MPNLLLELQSEEIPARLQERAAADLQRLMTGGLAAAGLDWALCESFAGPRRLTLRIDGLPEASPDTREERKGPRVDAPAKAIEGFLRGAGLSDVSEAEVQETKKGPVYVAIIQTKGRPVADVVCDVLRQAISDFPWPKAQRWGDGELRWVRPLRGILLSLDGQRIDFALDNGSQPIVSGLSTVTHRVLGTGAVEAPDFSAYDEALARGRVILRADDRKARILEGARALCAAEGLALVEDQGLLGEVAGLVEWPTPHLGRFDETFLTLPDEVITAAMRGHQKYFSVHDPRTGRLAPRFVCVADIEAGEGMLRGYERVLTARLSDALFLYRNDLRKPLERHAEKLFGVTFFEGLGTIADKVDRVAALARQLAPACGADPDRAEKAARLAKADLATEMVYEFPELQGLMGRYYALEQGVDPDIADAIRDHYKPQGQADDLPANALGVAVSLADKLDTLAAFWSIDEKPTGSRDPFALRRAALAVTNTVLSEGLRFGLRDVLTMAQALQANTSAGLESLIEFFHDRLTVYFRDQGYRHDRVAAALEEGADDFVLVEKKMKALSDFLDTPDGENLSAAYKRAANILKAEAKKGDLPDAAVDAAVFEQDEEKTLHEALGAAEAEAEAALGTEDFSAAMRALSGIRAPLDAFFEHVTVNADTPGLRANRLAQLLRFRTIVRKVADFDRLEG